MSASHTKSEVDTDGYCRSPTPMVRRALLRMGDVGQVVADSPGC
ncbi:hypothetical protein [Coleofasciculus sp. E1-EBD-02]